MRTDFGATVCKTVRPMLSHGCLSVLSVCDVGVLWPNGWMGQDETWNGGRPGSRPYCVRWGPSSPTQKGHSPPIFAPCLSWPNGWVKQDATWYGSRPRPRPHCVRWGPSCPSKKRTGEHLHFSAHVLWANGWMDQDATWYGGRYRPRPQC